MDKNLKHYDKEFYSMHIDWQSDYRHISDWIALNLNADVYGDIGCGNGYIIRNLYKNNKKQVWGIDGSKNFINFVNKSIAPYVKVVDLTERHKLQRSDVSICLEVAEHIEEGYSDIFVQNVVSTKARTIIFTAAPPGQEGISHVNLKPAKFWLKKFKKHGYLPNDMLAQKFRRDLSPQLKHTKWYLNNIMILEKKQKPLKQLIEKFTIRFKKKEEQKLIMTLLVRDEADIIRQNIEFHLRQGVDFIIATDNGSVDKTKEILREYERVGKLYLIEEEELNYDQATWVNRMGRIAYEEYGADIVFHCDADEFWFSKSGNLKKEIMESSADILVVDLVNVLLEDRGGKENFPGDAIYAIVSPVEARNLEEESKKTGLYFFKYPQKVIFKTKNKFFEVLQGNHGVTDGSAKIEKSADIIIYHYPIRSKDHFFKKVVNGGTAYKKNKRLAQSIGFHWRRWFDYYKKGELELEYRKLIVPAYKAKHLISSGEAKIVNFEEVMRGQ